MAKMTKIEAILKGKFKDGMVENKIGLFKNMLENARLGFKDDILETSSLLDAEIASMGESCGKGNIKDVIRRMSEIMDKKADAEEGLKRITEIEKYIMEEVEADEKDDKN